MTTVNRVGSLATLGRGLRCRCGRCGGRKVLQGPFRLKDRCPACGYRFKREEGFFTGVFLINFAATLAVMWVLLMGYTLWRSTTDGGNSVPILAVGIAIGLVMPILFYPVAVTTWAALDLVLRPLEPEEEADAALHTADPAGSG